MLQEKNLGVFFLSKDCEIILKKVEKKYLTIKNDYDISIITERK